jgi:hypothetical protein
LAAAVLQQVGTTTATHTKMRRHARVETMPDSSSQPSFDAVAMGIDAAESIRAGNSIEKMLAHQMAVTHEAAMRMLDRGLRYENDRDQGEACRCINAGARLFGAFNDAVLTLQRIRTGGTRLSPCSMSTSHPVGKQLSVTCRQRPRSAGGPMQNDGNA